MPDFGIASASAVADRVELSNNIIHPSRGNVDKAARAGTGWSAHCRVPAHRPYSSKRQNPQSPKDILNIQKDRCPKGPLDMGRGQRYTLLIADISAYALYLFVPVALEGQFDSSIES
jgi:hypothetical protein